MAADNDEATLSKRELENRKASLETFIEQTKLLESLASAFVIAPAAVQAFLTLQIDWRIIVAEGSFILSVLSSYFALATVTGSQRDGKYDVYRPMTRAFGMLQFFAYVVGLALFAWWLLSNQAAAVGPVQP